jgi:hypothetical protein
LAARVSGYLNLKYFLPDFFVLGEFFDIVLAEHISIGRPDFFRRLDVRMGRSLAGACENALAFFTGNPRSP